MGTCETTIRPHTSVDHNLAKVGLCAEAELSGKALKAACMPALTWARVST